MVMQRAAIPRTRPGTEGSIPSLSANMRRSSIG